jgi:hypothetical protein
MLVLARSLVASTWIAPPAMLGNKQEQLSGPAEPA